MPVRLLGRWPWIWGVLVGLTGLGLFAYYAGMPAYVLRRTAQMAGNRFVGGNEPFRGASFCQACHPRHYEQ